MSDVQVLLHNFSTDVVNALNEANVVPAEDSLCAVMLLVGVSEEGPALGGSLNYIEAKGRWEFMPQVSEPQPYYDDKEALRIDKEFDD